MLDVEVFINSTYLPFKLIAFDTAHSCFKEKIFIIKIFVRYNDVVYPRALIKYLFFFKSLRMM